MPPPPWGVSRVLRELRSHALALRLQRTVMPCDEAASAAKSSSSGSKRPVAWKRARARAVPAAHACGTFTLRVSTQPVHERVFQ